ncbi:MAG: hypothetical protein CMO55_07760 [Verrucomicrobiales bacterium]|nr:hypothetical protein [Verrucomicrobiales bacterium]
MTTDQKIPKSIEALSVLSGVPEENVAVQIACLFTAIGGPHAGLVTLGDEFQSVGFHLLQLSGDSAKERRLLDLLFQPLRFLQEDLMKYSRLAPSTQLDWMARAFINDKRSDEYLPLDPSEERVEGTARNDVYYLADLSSQAVSLSSPWRRMDDVDRFLDKVGCKTALPVDGIHSYLPGYPMLSQSYVGRNEGRCLYEPVFFLDNPGLEVLRKPWEGVDRGFPLILDETGQLWNKADTSAAARKILTEVLAERTSANPSTSSKERYRTGRAQVLSVVQEKLGRKLLSEPALESLLSGTLMGTVTPREDRDTKLTPEEIAEGYEQYRTSLTELTRLRRLDALGVWWKTMSAEATMELHRRQLEFVDKLEAVDGGERPFTARFASLPVSMLWTLSHLAPKERINVHQVSLAMTWAEAAIRSHLTSLREFRHNAENERIERKAAEMLWKLLEVEPASFRDLMRKYPVQRREVHEPVLKHLVESGKVLRLEDNKLRLTDETRAELASRSGDVRMLA